MKLKDYIEQEGLRYDKFAQKLGISVSQYYHLIHDRADPRLSIILKIQKLTRNKVRLKDWMPSKKDEMIEKEDKANKSC
jgi:transcriptional regulator with XRE-family HTH domain